MTGCQDRWQSNSHTHECLTVNSAGDPEGKDSGLGEFLIKATEPASGSGKALPGVTSELTSKGEVTVNQANIVRAESGPERGKSMYQGPGAGGNMGF